jgi:Base plate wedge protein 53
MKHFYYYPTVEYGNETLVNIMLRGKIRDAVLKKAALYYQYQIKDGQRPDIIAEKYYGNPRYTWAIFYANNIFHPIYDWPMDQLTFNKYLNEKYGVSYPKGTLAQTHHYELYNKHTKQKLIVDRDTYLKHSSSTKMATKIDSKPYYEVVDNKTKERYEISEWVYENSFKNTAILVRSVSMYDYEVEKNDARRNIFVLDKKYISQLTNEFLTLFK